VDGQGKPLKGSTAAGAYQILSGTWQEIFDKGLIEPKGDRFSRRFRTGSL
jgi:muramidase (phage lysozyme)